MSEQYQRFKQNFFKQHPPSASESKPNQQTTTKSFKQYDPYNEYTSEPISTYRHGDDQLRIDNETHFPFQQIQQTTFQDLDHDPFLSYKQQNSSHGLEKSFTNQKYTSNNTLSNNHHQLIEHQYRTYTNDQPGRELPIRTESQLEYRSVSKQEFDPDNFMRTQQSGIDKINNKIDRLRQTRQQHITQSPPQLNEYQHQNASQNNFTQYGYEANKQYLLQNNRANNLLPASPPKQLPVIYNRPNSQTNSQYKINPQTPNTNNSRVIIQQIQQTAPNLQKSAVLLSPSSPSIHPHIVNQSHTFNQTPQIPQPLNSGSRVIIQSEIVGQSKGLIHSNHNIPPAGYNLVHQPVVINSPPQVNFDNRILQESTVSLKEYERLRNQCSMWQKKFYQVNDQLNRLQSEREINSYGHGFPQQTVLVREENARLIEKIRILQSSDKNSLEKIKISYEELMKKYQSSLMKEANLLIDRFRLEMKHNERY